MHVLSWNIQWGRGADGRADLARTVAVLRDAGSPDIICLQEVACGWPGLKGQAEPEDGPAYLRAALPEYHAIYFPSLERGDGCGGTRGFGNMIMSRLPIGQVFRHLLPAPPDPAVPSMQRGCLEVCIDAAGGPLRILTTHLEYYSKPQRLAQAGRLWGLQQEAIVEARQVNGRALHRGESIFGLPARGEAAVLCGDMNCEPGSPEYQAIIAPSGGGAGASGWFDTWPSRHGALAHEPSVGLHGAEWPDRQYCCDYFFVSGELTSRVRDLRVLAEVAASDHQPLLLELAC